MMVLPCVWREIFCEVETISPGARSFSIRARLSARREMVRAMRASS